MLIYLHNVISKKDSKKKKKFNDVLRITKIAGLGSGSISQIWIRGSGSVPKFHGSATLL
jgi:hypothetical protein